ncbi:MAG: carbohydrate binding domain-containing protein [Saprospiraceae bacterium]|nr:carbohydrate binding domain-containing protein [Saprospiraceae bacterium]
MRASLPYFLLLFISLAAGQGVWAQCETNPLTNAGFDLGASVDWWSWHDNSPDAYTFASSDDVYSGDSSAVINVLMDTDLIPGGQGAEYNSRPQAIPITAGEFYEIRFASKSTLENTTVIVYIKDENDNWIQLHREELVVGTDWTVVSSIFQADVDREDVHLELKVYNEDFHEAYSVWFDEVSVCPATISTLTCDDNIVGNPGFESGIDTEWGNWHSNNPDAYTFETSTDAYIGNSSALIRVLKSSSEITGAGEYNSRPQESAIEEGQNYELTVVAKSSLENTTIQAWVKDEFDGWVTIYNTTLTVGTDWTTVSAVFAADQSRADVHLELKVFNETFTEPYDVWIDEVSICPTDKEPGEVEEPEQQAPVFGTNTDFTTCNSNLVPGGGTFDPPLFEQGWDIWDGDSENELSTFTLDPVLPYSGSNSLRIDIPEAHNVAEFHHRFGDRITLEDGVEYTMSMWIRSDVPEGDTVKILARPVRDTDWEAQTFVDFLVTENEWLNFTHTFTAEGTWDNAFMEFKASRLNDAFSDAYSIWYDNISLCPSADAITDVDQLTDLGWQFKLLPNPVKAGFPINLQINAPASFQQASLRLLDVMGKVHSQQQVSIQAGLQQLAIPTAGLPAGVYILQVLHESHLQSMKVQITQMP